MLDNERGDIIVLTALSFTVLIGLISLALDVGTAYMYRARMYEIANIMRDTRFTRNSNVNSVQLNVDNPGQYMAQNFYEYARLNGFNGKIEVIYKEKEPEPSKRSYKITFIMEDKYKTTSMKVFGIDELTIRVKIDGSGYSSSGNIWYPSGDAWKNYSITYPYE